jgi:hypothetical protein
MCTIQCHLDNDNIFVSCIKPILFISKETLIVNNILNENKKNKLQEMQFQKNFSNQIDFLRRNVVALKNVTECSTKSNSINSYFPSI